MPHGMEIMYAPIMGGDNADVTMPFKCGNTYVGECCVHAIHISRCIILLSKFKLSQSDVMLNFLWQRDSI